MENKNNNFSNSLDDIQIQNNPSEVLSVKLDLKFSFQELLCTGLIAGWKSKWHEDFRKYVEITEGLPDDFAGAAPESLTTVRIRLHRRAYLDWRKKNLNQPMYDWSEAEMEKLQEQVKESKWISAGLAKEREKFAKQKAESYKTAA